MRPLDDETLATLGHLNRIEAMRTLARWSGPAGRIVEHGGVLLFASATTFPVLFNGVDRVGTVEAARGRGLGDLVTRAVTNRSLDEGAPACTLQASPMGEPIYARMGYEQIYRYRGLVRFEAPVV